MLRAPRLLAAAALSLLATGGAVRSHEALEELAEMGGARPEAGAPGRHRGNSSALESGGGAALAARSGHATQAQLGVGRVLDGRYELKQFLGRFDARGGHLQRWEKVGAFPKIKAFPAGARKHLGTGSFGDAWKAWDKLRKKHVAVKIFFKGGYYLTPSLVAKKGYQSLVDEAAAECKEVMKIMKQRQTYEQGAQHICECYEAHTSDKANQESPLYLVQEMCGDSFFDLFVMNLHNPSSFTVKHPKLAKDPKWMMKAIAGTLEGVKFLSKLGYSHHDLKLENVVVTEDGAAKIIDFGGLTTMEKAAVEGGVCTSVYTPKEVRCPYAPGVDPGAPVYSFDDYSVGIMLFVVSCRSASFDSFRDHAQCGEGEPRDGAPVSNGVMKLAAKLARDYPAKRPDPAAAAKELRSAAGIAG
uniref:Protein kinase domain-containing protein n=1 Tax=Alexandrium catenella TaxID=2925 RepID=A0A7S1REX9_ALECA